MNGGGGGGHRLDQKEHTPLYENDKKQTKNIPMETTFFVCKNYTRPRPLGHMSVIDRVGWSVTTQINGPLGANYITVLINSMWKCMCVSQHILMENIWELKDFLQGV